MCIPASRRAMKPQTNHNNRHLLPAVGRPRSPRPEPSHKRPRASVACENCRVKRTKVRSLFERDEGKSVSAEHMSSAVLSDQFALDVRAATLSVSTLSTAMMKTAGKHSRRDMTGPTAKGTSSETSSTCLQREQNPKPTRYTNVCGPAEIQFESCSRSNKHTCCFRIPLQSHSSLLTRK